MKKRTSRFCEVNDPEEAVGLWSCTVVRRTALRPVGPTRHTISNFLLGDLARAASPGESARLSFGSAMTGLDCSERRHRTGRVLLLRRGGFHYVGVMMKSGWSSWEHVEEDVGEPERYEWMVMTARDGFRWQGVRGAVIDNLVRQGHFCLFEIEDDPELSALTDDRNAKEEMARLSRCFEFYIERPNQDGESFTLAWSAVYNPRMSRYENPDKFNVRLVETMRERRRDWINRSTRVSEETVADAAAVARWVVEHNGCAVLPSDASDELVRAMSRALFYVVFPDRPIDAPGGYLRGYQMPGRMVRPATGQIRFDGVDAIREHRRRQAEQSAAEKRALVVETLLERACRVLLQRNQGEMRQVKGDLERIGAREILETAAARWGFFEGHALVSFAPSAQAGSLKLPDLSLALAFEHRLGLKGELATADRLVQTACILPLPDTLDSRRHVRDVVITARREHLPRKGREHEPVVYPADTVRILRDNGRYYLLAIPKYSVYSYERDLKFAPDSESVGVDGFRFVSSGGVRSRKDVSIVNEKFDLEKVRAMARDGRVYLYSLEVGVHRPLFDATYALANRAPCRIVTTIPQLFAPGSVSADAKSVKVRLAFTFNPSVPRVNRKFEGRSWKSYCDAYPSDSRRTVVRWQPSAGAGDSSLRDACRRVVETDGVLLVDDRDVKPTLEAMGYVVTQTGDPNAAGGIYRGYMIADRVFRLTDGRVERCAAKGGKCRAPDRRSALVGKPLVEALSAAKAAEAEAEFVRLVEANSLTDRKTAAVFTLEAPVVVGNEFKEMVAREFRRVVYTGTMSWKRQLVRPAREVALGIWLARLEPCPSEEVKAKGEKPKKIVLHSEQAVKRLATLDALLSEGLVTEAEYAAKKSEILSSDADSARASARDTTSAGWRRSSLAVC